MRMHKIKTHVLCPACGQQKVYCCLMGDMGALVCYNYDCGEMGPMARHSYDIFAPWEGKPPRSLLRKILDWVLRRR